MVELLNSVDKEGKKTAEQRGEDIAYTINHAIACSTTDFIDPFVSKWFQDKLGVKVKIGCGHDHSKDGHHHHHDHDHPHDHHQAAPHGTLGHSLIGEVAGDFAAVPITIGFQRFAPSFMRGIQSVLEPTVGWVFDMSAEKSTRRWAMNRNITYNSEAYQQHKQEIYDHEMSHLPQAVVWTLASIGINVATQKATGNTHAITTIAAGKTLGTLLTTSLVLGSRTFAPKTARNIDQYTSKNIFTPVSKFVSGMLGVKEEVIDQVIAEEDRLKGRWQDEVEKSIDAANQSASR